jgi:hypothetical protein
VSLASVYEEYEALGVEFLAIISGVYGGNDFVNPDQADDYISDYGLKVAATYDPEGFWGIFSMYIPSNVIIDLQTMEIKYLDNTMDTSSIRNILDQLLGL